MPLTHSRLALAATLVWLLAGCSSEDSSTPGPTDATGGAGGMTSGVLGGAPGLGGQTSTATCTPACRGDQLCSNGQCVCADASTIECNGACVNTNSNSANCGVCGNVCSGSTPFCQNGQCTSSCTPPTELCGSSCINPATYQSDSSNCGACGVSCAASGQGPVCTAGVCGCGADPNYAFCGGNCVNTANDLNNCGACGVVCSAGQTCTAAGCVGGGTGGATGAGGNTSVGQGGNTVVGQGGNTVVGQGGNTVVGQGGATEIGQGGATEIGQGGATEIGQGGATEVGQGGSTEVGQGGSTEVGQGGSTEVGQGGNTGCAAEPFVLSNFEEGVPAAGQFPIAIEQDGRHGCWETFQGTTTTNFTLNVEQDAASTDPCNNYYLHAVGTSAAGWGDYVGVSVNFVENGTCGNPTATDPQPYDASKYAGIRFRAKVGPGHDPKSPVRVNIALPASEENSANTPAGTCVATTATATRAATPCWQHMGRFLHVVSGYEPTTYNDVQLTSEWKTFSLCFDRDMYPLSLPSILTNAQRDALPQTMTKLQFQFNQGKDWYVSQYPTEGDYQDLAKNLPFDFYVDDIEFIEGECPNSTAYPSLTNQALGTCEPATGAAKYNNALSQAYDRWKKNFVRNGNTVVAVEQDGGVVTSESMGYGMLIALAMGDQAQFDAFWGYVDTQLNGNGLMTWISTGTGSATDGDVDIAYALYVAGQKWGGNYGAEATAMISAINTYDVDGGTHLGPGDGWGDNVGFNPSYFAPSYFRVFGGMDAVITSGYSLTDTNTGSNFPTDWTDMSGGAIMPIGSVTAKFNKPAYGYDAARVPWRLGLDACETGTDANGVLGQIVGYFANLYDGGSTIDLMKGGWIKETGQPAGASDGATAADMQGSFIGPLGVGAMATGNDLMRDRALRTILDILENGDFNHTYFPSSVGFLSALAMTGNFPTP